MKKIELEKKLAETLIELQTLKEENSFLETVEFFDISTINRLKKHNTLLKCIIAGTYTGFILGLIIL